eukprot:102416-Chlamydomonas_euryale.AAC.1
MQVVRDRLVYQADGTAGAEGEGERDEVPCTKYSSSHKIVYDNCCNLHKYAMRRQPSFVFKTRFVIDRMHAKGH